MTLRPAPLWPLLVAIGVPSLAGCAGSDTRYPSLAIRDAERAILAGNAAPPAAAPAPVVQVDPALIAAPLERAREAHARFLDQRPATLDLARAASGLSNDSDRRSRALVALANLTTIRADTALALADLDRLEAETATQLSALEAIEEAQGEVARLVEVQDESLDAAALALGL
ncbi:hypothetical protein [Erythrobacter sp.]|jgi:hypothetical protein|uniref:hypothetical protein n=1 Tax=Erythrobacter sp. TaxID=1042 RepID=UPI002EAAEF9E|nr:hypothetical protein [Erythrobacter sp.]